MPVRSFLRTPLFIFLSLSLKLDCNANDALSLWEEPNFPIEVALHIAKYTPTVLSQENEGNYALKLSTPFNLRLTSHFWKIVAEDMFIRENIYKIILSPKNYLDPVLPRIAGLGTSLILKDWDKTNADQLGIALNICSFPHVKYLGLFTGARLIHHSADIGEEGAVALASGFKNFPGLTFLHIDGCSIGERGGKAIGRALQYIPKLETLILEGQMGPLGTLKFAKGLKKTQKLQKLLLEGNGVGDSGCKYIALKLKHLPHLSVLSLSNVYQDAPGGGSRFISDIGAIVLAYNIKKYYKITPPHVELSGHAIGDEGTEALKSIFENVSSGVELEKNKEWYQNVRRIVDGWWG